MMEIQLIMYIRHYKHFTVHKSEEFTKDLTIHFLKNLLLWQIKLSVISEGFL